MHQSVGKQNRFEIQANREFPIKQTVRTRYTTENLKLKRNNVRKITDNRRNTKRLKFN